MKASTRIQARIPLSGPPEYEAEIVWSCPRRALSTLTRGFTWGSGSGIVGNDTEVGDLGLPYAVRRV